MLAAAPPRLIRAGLGDSACRSTAQADWLLSHMLLDRPYRQAAGKEERVDRSAAPGEHLPTRRVDGIPGRLVLVAHTEIDLVGDGRIHVEPQALARAHIADRVGARRDGFNKQWRLT